MSMSMSMRPLTTRGKPGRRWLRSGLVASLTREPHRHIVGAGRGARFTHLIRVASPAGVAGGISIGARVGYCRDHDSIAVDVDVG